MIKRVKPGAHRAGLFRTYAGFSTEYANFPNNGIGQDYNDAVNRVIITFCVMVIKKIRR